MVLVLGFKLGISGMLGEHSTPELHPELMTYPIYKLNFKKGGGSVEGTVQWQQNSVRSKRSTWGKHLAE